MEDFSEVRCQELKCNTAISQETHLLQNSLIYERKCFCCDIEMLMLALESKTDATPRH